MLRCTPVVVVFLAACGIYSDSEPDPDLEQFCEAETVIPAHNTAELDVLFVVDNSTSMADQADKLRLNFEWFADVLENIEGGLPSVHIGVVTTDIAEAGVMREPFLIHERRPWFTCSDTETASCSLNNFDGALADALVSIADVGSDGSDTEMPLEAATLALEANPGFLRSDAFLFVAVITDDDDDSESAVDTYVEALKDVKPDPGMVLVAAAMPDTATRLRQFLDSFPNRNSSTSIDNDDLVDIMVQVASSRSTTLGVPCLRGDFDEGELECTARDLDSNETLVACDMDTPTRPAADTALPCYWIEEDPLECDSGKMVRIEGAIEPSTIEIRCASRCDL